MLYDKDFLLKLDKSKSKTIYAKITALTFSENPIQTIEGRVTQGSINIDGASAVRRTCSLTIVGQNFDYNNYYWGLNTKFKLEIGVQNLIDKNYPDIIWFNQGIYLITGFNTSRSTTNFSISINGKDKMCLLNGEVGGALESSVDFGTIEEENDDGIWIIKKLTLQEIIKNAVHVYAGEPYHNIIINDLDGYGKELLEYRLDTPAYIYKLVSDVTYKNILLDGKKLFYQWTKNEETGKYEKVLNETKNHIRESLEKISEDKFDLLIDSLIFGNHSNYYFTIESSIDYNSNGYPTTDVYKIAKIQYGDTIGYRETDLTYAGDLIANVGESITSVLDKIKNMLVEFEYFYDLDGRFVFQKKRNYINTIWSPEKSAEDAKPMISYSLGTEDYVFSGGEFITTFNNNPNLLNVRNDFSIWGERVSVSGAKIPIHFRYAIDTKPTYYRTIDGTKFFTTEKKEMTELIEEIKKELVITPVRNVVSPNGLPSDWWDIRDWAEYYKSIIGTYPPGMIGEYCKDKDGNKQYVKKGDINLNDYFPSLEDKYKWTNQDIYIFDVFFNGYPNDPSKWSLGYTGHGAACSHAYNYFLKNEQNEVGTSFIYKPEIPLADIAEFDKKVEAIVHSRLYNQDWREIIYQMAKDYYKNNQLDDFELKLSETNLDYYPSGQTGYEKYYIDIQGFWRQLYCPIDEELYELNNKKNEETDEKKIENLNNKIKELEKDAENYYLDGEKKNWNKMVFEQPHNLNFWFDFLDTEGELKQFSVKSIGSRPKSIKDTNIKSIYFRDTPEIQIVEDASEDNELSGYGFIQIPGEYQNIFSISGQGKSAKEKLDELIYQHGYCIESATINTIPIYYLEPNSRIYINDEKTNIIGYYNISKISLPLTYNGTMSLTATKVQEQDI